MIEEGNLTAGQARPFNWNFRVPHQLQKKLLLKITVLESVEYLTRSKKNKNDKNSL